MIRVLGTLALTWAMAVAASAQEIPKAQEPTKEHQWLKQFVGEWETEGESVAMNGQPAMKCKGTMKSRMIGDLWVVSDLKTEMPGMQIEALQTIGYDPAAKTYIGTWADSHLGHLWTYKGKVDEKGTVLTLEAEGPDFTSPTPGKMANYRDAYEFKSKDHIVLSSSAQGPDGKWVLFMTSHMRRVDKPSK